MNGVFNLRNHLLLHQVFPGGRIACSIVFGLFFPFFVVACGSMDHEAERFSQAEDREQVERGRYLVTIVGCNDCHTPYVMGAGGPEPDMTRMLSGHPQELVMTLPKIEEPWGFVGAATNTAYGGPWGISFAFNLTPDLDTGIGSWSEDIFVQTLRTGKHWGQSRPILPPMPWPWYSQMTDEDLKAIFAYLRTVPAIHNRVPEPVPPAEPTPVGVETF